MRIYPIASHVLAAKYRGEACAMAAVREGVVVDLVYMVDLIDGFVDPDLGMGDNAQAMITDTISDPRLRPAIEQLRCQGAITVGLCSAREFVAL